MRSGRGTVRSRSTTISKTKSSATPFSCETLQIRSKLFMMAAVLFATLCATWLPLSLQQVVPAALGSSGLCHVSQEDLRVLPSSGFTRSTLEPFTNTTYAGSEELVPIAANLTGCLFESYDPAFDAIIGSTTRTIYQVGPTRSEPWAVESPAYLPGIALPAAGHMYASYHNSCWRTCAYACSS